MLLAVIKKITIFVSLAILFISCAGVKLYSDAEMTKRTGLVFYNAKPFLLCQCQKDTVSVSLIFLPDLTKPTYAKVIRGLGSSKLSLTMKDGYLTSYGVESNAEIPALVTSLSGLLTALTGKQDSTELASAKPCSTFELYEILEEQGKITYRKVNLKNP